MPDDRSLDPTARAGFTEVDNQPDTTRLVNGMLQTAQWEAVRRLRAWERDHLTLRAGDRLVDVGCGVGDVVCEMAMQILPGGSALGVDASEAMLGASRTTAAQADVEVEFTLGNALALDLPDDSFDVCRSERMLQWVPDVAAAVAEMVRVVRPGGQLSLIDTDWRTMMPDLPDGELVRRVIQAMYDFRGPSSSAGGQLVNICRELGLIDIECTADAHTWTEWDPDVDDAPSGFFPVAPVIREIAEAGVLDPADGERFIEQCYRAARTGRLFISLTMVAVSARVPG